jgi:hypothetical protein
MRDDTDERQIQASYLSHFRLFVVGIGSRRQMGPSREQQP